MNGKKCFIRAAAAAVLCATLLLFIGGTGAAENTYGENIARGKAYTFATGQPTVHSYDRYSSEYDNDRGQLTDGMYAKESTDALGWISSFRSSSRVVTFDFEKQVTVTGMAADFLHDPTNYHAPRETRLFLSDDGEHWFLAGTVTPGFSLASAQRRYKAEVTIEPYAARYVRVEYTVDVFALCDEIEIYGAETAAPGAKTVVPDPEEEQYFCTSLGDAYGITDIIKIYNGYYPANQDKADNTAAELLPYVGYLDKDGKILDTMFDAVAFVPCVATDFTYPSGGTLGRNNKYPAAVMSDWILYTDFLFQSERDLRALDEAVGNVYGELQIEGKFPVLLTMFYPAKTNKAFGDLDGDGTDEYTRTADERVSVISWYDEYLTSRFENAGFRNLDFVGYYWYNETIDESWSAEEREFTTRATELLRKNGKVVLYDPFYLSLGYDQWEEYGFSGAVMQPNVSFLKSRPYFELDMLDEFAVAIASEHLGVEIETDEPSYFLGDDPERPAQYYERYLFVGAKTGYMDAIHTFYQGAGPGALYDFCKATGNTPADIRLRRLYDITYQFIKGTYRNLPPEVTSLPADLTTEKGQRLKFEIAWQDGDSYPGDIRVTVSEPEHGKAQVSPNRRTVTYLPEEGFEGEDGFKLTITDGQNEARSYDVRVKVGQTAPDDTSEESAAEPEPDGTPAWVWWLVGGGAFAVICASVIVIITVLRRRA